MITAYRPSYCLICGYYLTTNEQYTGNRCVDPGHWQAAGLLASYDFYLMARMVAGARAELARRPDKRGTLSAQIHNSGDVENAKAAVDELKTFVRGAITGNKKLRQCEISALEKMKEQIGAK